MAKKGKGKPAHKAENKPVMINPFTGDPTGITPVPVVKDIKGPEGLPEEKPVAKKIPSSVEKLSITKKKKFLQLLNENAHFTAFNSYLGLNRTEVQWCKDNVDDIRAFVNEHDKAKAAKRERDRKAAEKDNDEARKHGKLLPPEEVSTKKKKWVVPTAQRRQFLRDAAVRSTKYLAEIYHPEGCTARGVSETDREVVRLEKSGQ